MRIPYLKKRDECTQIAFRLYVAVLSDLKKFWNMNFFINIFSFKLESWVK